MNKEEPIDRKHILGEKSNFVDQACESLLHKFRLQEEGLEGVNFFDLSRLSKDDFPLLSSLGHSHWFDFVVDVFQMGKNYVDNSMISEQHT